MRFRWLRCLALISRRSPAKCTFRCPAISCRARVVGLPGIIAAEAGKSRKNAQYLLAAFEAAAAKAGVSSESVLEKCKTFEAPELLVEYARLRDLTIMPESNDRWYAEAVMFGSGRPTLILPQEPRSRPFELGTVAVAWDFSRAAARAVSDAMPLLEKAKKVRIVTVLNEKRLDNKHSAEELAKNFWIIDITKGARRSVCFGFILDFLGNPLFDKLYLLMDFAKDFRLVGKFLLQGRERVNQWLHVLIGRLIRVAVRLPCLSYVWEIRQQFIANALAKCRDLARSKHALNPETLESIKILTVNRVCDDCCYELPAIFLG